MERNLVLKEIDALQEAVALPLEQELFSEAEVKLYPAGKYFGLLREKSFLRKPDLKGLQTYNGKALFYPNQQQVAVLGENSGWLLVKGAPLYQHNGTALALKENNRPAEREGWLKKEWVDMRPAATTDAHTGKAVDIKGKVKAPLGIKLHRAPNPATKLTNSKIYPQNADVTIIGLPSTGNDPNWYKIRTDDGQEGWIESRYITPLPNADLRLVVKEFYIAKANDRLDPLVRSRYPAYNIQTGDDYRTIIHAFSLLNADNPAIYYKGVSDSWWRDHVFDRDMAPTRQIYASIKLRAGGLIYFPTDSYINYLKDTGKVTQRPEWKNHAIRFGKSLVAFMEGFIEGCETFVKGLWEDLKNLFSLSFFKDIYNMIKGIIDDPLEFLKGIREMLLEHYEKVKTYITKPAPQRFFGVGIGCGLICGMVIQNSLNPAAELATKLARFFKLKGLNKLISKIEKLDPHSPEYKKAAKRLEEKIEKASLKGRKWTALEMRAKIARGVTLDKWSSLEKEALDDYFKTLKQTKSYQRAGEAFHKKMGAAPHGADKDLLGFQVEYKTSLKTDEQYLADFATVASAQTKNYAFAFQNGTGWVKGRVITMYLLNFRPPVKITLN